MRPRSTSGTTSKHKGSENFKIQDTRRSLSPFLHQLAWRRSIFFPLPFFWHSATERLPFVGALLQAKVRLLILYTLVSFFVSARMVVASSFGHIIAKSAPRLCSRSFIILSLRRAAWKTILPGTTTRSIRRMEQAMQRLLAHRLGSLSRNGTTSSNATQT